MSWCWGLIAYLTGVAGFEATTITRTSKQNWMSPRWRCPSPTGTSGVLELPYIFGAQRA